MANKLFRKTSGSHAFVADFPAADGDGDVVFGGTEFDGGGCSPDPDDADASRCVKRARPQPQERNKKTLKYKYVLLILAMPMCTRAVANHVFLWERRAVTTWLLLPAAAVEESQNRR